MTEKFYVDSNGVWLGSFSGSAPNGGIEVPVAPERADQIWNFSSQTFGASAPQPYQIAKTLPWLRMTEDEAEQMYAQMQLTSPRLRGIYDAAQYLSSGDDLWQTLHDIIAATLSTSRADELLAPEG